MAMQTGYINYQVSPDIKLDRIALFLRLWHATFSIACLCSAKNDWMWRTLVSLPVLKCVLMTRLSSADVLRLLGSTPPWFMGLCIHVYSGSSSCKVFTRSTWRKPGDWRGVYMEKCDVSGPCLACNSWVRECEVLGKSCRPAVCD